MLKRLIRLFKRLFSRKRTKPSKEDEKPKIQQPTKPQHVPVTPSEAELQLKYYKDKQRTKRKVRNKMAKESRRRNRRSA